MKCVAAVVGVIIFARRAKLSDFIYLKGVCPEAIVHVKAK